MTEEATTEKKDFYKNVCERLLNHLKEKLIQDLKAHLTRRAEDFVIFDVQRKLYDELMTPPYVSISGKCPARIVSFVIWTQGN